MESMGPVQVAIEKKLTNGFQPEHLEVQNESHMHSVPKNSETHFKVFLVSEKFENVARVQRQRQVYQLLSEELEGPVHALSLRLLTPQQWEESGRAGAPQSPDCKGGSKISN